MPSPTTTDLPRPRSWEEFEDICADVLKKTWDAPYITRNGRSGQGQHGVDSYGKPARLGGQYAGAQCKKGSNALTIKVMRAEVEKAKQFQPTLAEFLMMTTASRDAKIQEAIRLEPWPFPVVHAMFWEDISLELSGHQDLLQKHFPDWAKRTTTEESVFQVIESSEPEDYRYDDATGEYFYTKDVQLRIVVDRTLDEREELHEDWAQSFTNPRATIQPVYIFYGATRIEEVLCANVDGGRHIIPYTTTPTERTLSPFRYHIGRILNHPLPARGAGMGFDFALKCAGITVRGLDDQA